MGLLRKTLLIGTAGLAPVKANSKKERTAKATEKMLRLQQKQARAAAAPPPAHSSTPTGRNFMTPAEGPSAGQLARQARRDARAKRQGESGGESMTDELERLAALHEKGALTDDEFAAAKAKALGA